jgi:hypothetical protein
VANDVTDTVVDTFQDARRRVEERIDSAREAIEVKKEQVHRAMEAGRAAAQEAREELERRIAETKASYHSDAKAATSTRAVSGRQSKATVAAQRADDEAEET